MITSECFKVAKDKVYLIREKINDNTPPEIRKLGRAKETAISEEPITCAYFGEPDSGAYDTGFDISSKEFRGVSDSKVKSILKERKPLIDHFNREFENFKRSNPNASETDFLSSSRCTLNAKHGLVVDTSNFHNYFVLYLASRSSQLAPQCDANNPNYNSADFTIAELKETNGDEQYSLRKKKLKIDRWFADTYEKDPELVKNYLTYVGVLSHGRKATEGVMLSLLDKWTADRENGDRNIEYLLETIENTDEEQIYIQNKIGRAIRLKKIERISGKYIMDGRTLGRTKTDAYHTLMKQGNEDLLEMLLENE